VDPLGDVAEVEALLAPSRAAGYLLGATAGQIPSGWTRFALGPLAPEESLQLLARRSDRHKLQAGERPAVQRLAAELGYLPAALCRVADFVRHSGCTWLEAAAALPGAAGGTPGPRS
jgi:hypothetical protein